MGLSVAYRKLQLEMLGGSGCGPVPGTADGWFVARTSVRDVGGSLGILAFATFLRTSSFRFWLPSPATPDCSKLLYANSGRGFGNGRGCWSFGERTEILFAGRFRPTGGAGFGSQGPLNTSLVGFPSQVETRVTHAMLAAYPRTRHPCAQLWSSTPFWPCGEVTRLPCRARFSGRVVRSAEGLSPRESGVPFTRSESAS